MQKRRSLRPQVVSSPIAVALAALACSLAASGMLGSCGGGGAAVITVTVTPGTMVLAPEATCTFTAEVTGTTDTTVTWSVQEPGGGTITAGGFYTAPATEGTYHVVATSVADPTVSDSAEVTVHAGALGLTNLFFLHHSVGDNLVV